MNKLPTAEEFLNNYKFKAGEHIGNSDYDIMAKFAREFAKLHVEACKKDIVDKVKVIHKNYKGSHNISFPYSVDNYSDLHLDKESIFNAYPLTNIK